MKAVEKIIDVIFKAVEWVIAFLVGLMTALVFLQIVNRAILNVSLTWSEEIVNYSMIWIAMLGACVLVRNNGHMAIDNFIKALKGPLRKVIMAVSVLLQVAFVIVMLLGIIEFFPVAAKQFSPVLRLDMGCDLFHFLHQRHFDAAGSGGLLGHSQRKDRGVFRRRCLLKKVQEEERDTDAGGKEMI